MYKLITFFGFTVIKKITLDQLELNKESRLSARIILNHK
jgi:hypothetical protein